MSFCRFEGIIGQSDAMRAIFGFIEKVADTDSTIVINGETGTGKGMVARAIHNRSQRRRRPFVQVNCGAIPKDLLESELFGHVKGAFTGATTAKAGKFEVAAGGTLFLDEIGDMSMDLQVKLLKVLEEKEFEPVGGTRSIRADVRVIVATHLDLEARVREGLFRGDLFFRLYVIPVTLPPLRERTADVGHLAAYFLEYFNGLNDRRVCRISDAAMARLEEYDWPGNVRELKNAMERMVVLKESGELAVADLPEEIRRNTPALSESPPVDLTDDGVCLSSALSEFEKALIYKSLEKSNWVKTKAADLLRIKRTTLVEKIKRHHLQECA